LDAKRLKLLLQFLDTGLKIYEKSMHVNLCKTGHRDFTVMQKFVHHPKSTDDIPVDSHGHGTNIAGVIQDNAGDAHYCFVILKYYDPYAKQNDNLKHTINAIEYATKIGAKYINYSGGGVEFSGVEQRFVKEYLDKGGTFIAAAGNEKSDLEQQPYYPALDDSRVIAVGNLDVSGKMRSATSNYGKLVDVWEIGEAVRGFGYLMSGTSQASAVHTGKLLKKNEVCVK
jgi:major intracellular serine protease